MSATSRTDRGLVARDVTVTVDGTTILGGVDLTVLPGEVVVLVGPNGAGKSTLLGALTGDLEPTSGSVELDGAPVASYRARDLARRRAVLLQQQRLAFGFRAREVVEMGRAPWHRAPEADDDLRMIAEAEARADVSHLAERLFPTLSGGEQARVSFARVLAQGTRLLLLDEPTAALDLQHQEALLRVAVQEAREGSAVVVVLHDLSLAAAYGDRVCVLAHGAVRATGTPREVLTPALLSEVYQHPVDVVEHGGHLLVVPVRGRASAPPAPAPSSPLPKEDSCPV